MRPDTARTPPGTMTEPAPAPARMHGSTAPRCRARPTGADALSVLGFRNRSGISAFATRAQARLGELQQATDRFEPLLSLTDDLSLFGEEIDPSSGQDRPPNGAKTGPPGFAGLDCGRRTSLTTYLANFTRRHFWAGGMA
jgi:hypothetical protein